MTDPSSTDFTSLSDESLLQALAKERMPDWKPGRPIIDRNEQHYKAMINELIRRGVYPEKTVEGNPNTVFQMVEGYGAYWHTWKNPVECPSCKADLRDHTMGPPYKRELSIYSRETDRTTHFICRDCNEPISRAARAQDELSS